MKNDWSSDLDILDFEDLLEDVPRDEEADRPELKKSDTRPIKAQRVRQVSPSDAPKEDEDLQDVPDAGLRDTPEDETRAASDDTSRAKKPVRSYRERILQEDDSYIGWSDDEEDSYFHENGEPRGKKSRRMAGRKERRTEKSRGGEGRAVPVHLILPVVIAAVLAVAIVRLVIWNNGVEIDTTTSEGSFNVEVNDSMVILSSSDLEGAADDGVTTVLCLGNEPFSADTSSSGLAGQIAALGDVEVINAAFPDSQVTCENATYSTDSLDDMDDIFNLFYVAYAISIDDYTSLATVASAHEDETYANAVAALESTDFSAVDIIAIQYDGIDYINGMAMYNEDVPEELTTYVGSLSNAIILLREAYPHIRIVFMSPWYAEYDGASSRTTDLGNGTIVDYFQWAYDTCGSEGVSFLDNYYGSVNENNFEEYLSDGVNLNADGCTKIADHFVYKVIQGNYAEYNVEQMAVAE